MIGFCSSRYRKFAIYGLLIRARDCFYSKVRITNPHQRGVKLGIYFDIGVWIC